MKILIAPLNWGLGHATRCIPLIEDYLQQGHEVVLGGDGESLLRLKQQFPTLRHIELAPLHLTYSKHTRQVIAILRQLPRIIQFLIRDHYQLEVLLNLEHFDLVISDNRFTLYSSLTHCVYMTHQLHICLPYMWRWLEPLAQQIHTRIANHYDEVWVPDYEAKEGSLSGLLGHPEHHIPAYKMRYIGPLSRLTPSKYAVSTYDVVALLSGLEPQRSLLEQEIITRYSASDRTVLIIQGRVGVPATTIRHRNITIRPYIYDDELVPVLNGCTHIIARSGYSTIMDMKKLGLIAKVEFIPTPGQPEQEYLKRWLDGTL